MEVNDSTTTENKPRRAGAGRVVGGMSFGGVGHALVVK